MVEPPSRRLQQILLGLKLCSPRELRRCASRVKALSADLPAFDSVWLDALVQRRILTSWQAQTIEADRPELLRVGPCIVEDRIGQTHRSATYLAQLPDRLGQCAVKRVTIPTELKKSVTDRLKQLIEKSQRLSHPGVLAPYSVSEISNEPIPKLAPSEKLKESAATRASRQTGTASPARKRNSQAGVGRPRNKLRSAKSSGRKRSNQLNTELAIVSRWVDGLSFSEILLRRGRLPATDVDAIARQLLESLAAMHEAGIVHGDILPGNIRLLPSGQAVLVDAGIRPALQPEFQINAHVSPEQNDGIAPELIGTGAVATVRSDLYALGFALWHILAGRPAFPTGDPLAKLAAHQTERLPDIREFAPDTPDRLAQMIEWLTEPVAAHRPHSASEILSDGIRDRTTAQKKKPDAKKNGANAQTAGATEKSTKPRSLTAAVKPAGRSSRRRLSRFAASFQQPSRRSAQSSSTRKTATSLACASAAILLAVAALFTLDGRSRNYFLARLPQRLFQSVNGDALTPTETSQNQPDDHLTDQHAESTAVDTAPPEPETKTSPVPSAVEQNDRNRLRPPPRPDSQQLQAQITRKATQLLPLPEPDPYGLILLSEPGTYDASTVSWRGSHLIIRGSAEAPATILIAEQPLQLRATEVTLENLEIRLSPANNHATTLSRIRSQKLNCHNCKFQTPLITDHANSTQEPNPVLSADLAIQWAPIDLADPLAGELNFQNCQLVGSHSSIVIAAPGRNIRCTNTLKIGGGPLFIATGRAASGDNTFHIEQTTLRNSGSLIAINLQDAAPWKSRLTVKPISSVFDLRSRPNNQADSLITFVGGQLQLTWHERVSFEGDDSVAGDSVGLASWQASNGEGHQSIDAADVSVQGLMQTGFTFQGPPTAERTNSVLKDVQTNRLSSRLPGISNHSQRSNQNLKNEELLIGPELPSDL